MANRKTVAITALSIAAILMMASVLALLTSTKTVPSHGHIIGVNLKLYSDIGCTAQLTAIDWGDITNGSQSVQTIYIKNEGTATMTLNMTASGWSPSDVPTFTTLSWNRETYALANQTSIDADLTLYVLPSYTNGTDFTVDITITGTQQ